MTRREPEPNSRISRGSRIHRCCDLLSRPLVPRGHNQNHMVFHEGLNLEILAPFRTLDQGELDFPGQLALPASRPCFQSRWSRAPWDALRNAAINAGNRYCAMVCDAPTRQASTLFAVSRRDRMHRLFGKRHHLFANGTNALPPGVSRM